MNAIKARKPEPIEEEDNEDEDRELADAIVTLKKKQQELEEKIYALRLLTTKD